MTPEGRLIEVAHELKANFGENVHHAMDVTSDFLEGKTIAETIQEGNSQKVIEMIESWDYYM